MLEVIERQYAELYEGYGEGRALEPARKIKAAINLAQELNAGAILRSDAKYFLLINFYQMVYLPLAKANVVRDDLDRLMADDVKLIIDTAVLGMANGREDEGVISGNEILRATTYLIDRLRTSAQNIWG